MALGAAGPPGSGRRAGARRALAEEPRRQRGERITTSTATPTSTPPTISAVARAGERPRSGRDRRRRSRSGGAGESLGVRPDGRPAAPDPAIPTRPVRGSLWCRAPSPGAPAAPVPAAARGSRRRRRASRGRGARAWRTPGPPLRRSRRPWARPRSWRSHRRTAAARCGPPGRRPHARGLTPGPAQPERQGARG